MAALLERGLYSFWISIPKILVLRVTTFYSMFICWFDGDLSSVIQKSHQEIGLGILRKKCLLHAPLRQNTTPQVSFRCEEDLVFILNGMTDP